MKRDDRAFDRELEELLERGRSIRPLPDVVRARALARARATIAARANVDAARPAVAPPARVHRRRIALAAAFALLTGGAGAVAAIRGGVLERFHSPPLPAAPERSAPPHAPSPPAVVQQIAPSPKAIEKHRRAPTAQESYAVELGLLRRAQVAYASRDFSSALVLVAEHARRFPSGHLAEEREALRVRSLVGAGRLEDARRAVTGFAARFPRSVLLSRLQEATE